MKGRVFSTILLWTIVAIIAVFLGARGAIGLAVVAAFLTQREIYKMFEGRGHNPMSVAGLAVGVAISLSPALGDNNLLSAPSLIVPAIVILGMAAILCRPCGEITATFSSTIMGLILGPCLLSYVCLTIYHYGAGREGLLMALWVVMATKFTDMGALLTGLAIGRHKLAPTLSPKKTWEGVMGGIVLCVISSALYAYFCAEWLPSGFTPLVAGVIAFPLSIIAVSADLLESAFKRESQIKDSGRLIPGIGGVFDLTDSLMFCAPYAYYASVIFLG
jgi:phosphatidate cytidylyltransferase